MKHPIKAWFVAQVTAVAAVLACSAATLGAPNDKGNSMEGSWICLEATVNGKPLPEATVKQLRLTLTKDRYKTEKGSDVLFDSEYRVDATHNPPHIDIIGTEGDLKGKTAQGICRLSEDTLKLCYTMPGKNRPAKFESTVGSEAHYTVWKRR